MSINYKLCFLLFIVLKSNNFYAQCEGFPDFLKGTWEIETNDGFSYEEWILNDDNTLNGRTYKLFGKDTIEFERMEIKCYQGKPTYFMNAMMQNTQVRAGYIPIQITNNVWVWENQRTDFPKMLSYAIINDSVISVWFKGDKNNDTCVDFLMKQKNP
jgi:hypothetical protein